MGARFPVKLNVKVSEEVAAVLHREAARREVTVCSLAREAMREWANRQPPAGAGGEKARRWLDRISRGDTNDE